MAVADTLLVIFITLIYVSTRSYRTTLWWDNMGRKSVQILFITIFSFCAMVFGTVTLLTLLIISIERYRVTRRTVQISRPLSAKRRAIVIAVSWVMAMVMNLPDLPSIKFPYYIITNILYITLVSIFYFIMVTLSVLTLRSISKPQAIENSLSEEQRKQRKKRIRNVVKLVLYSLLLYSCCYIPWILFTIFNIYDRDSSIDWSTFNFITRFLLPLVNSSVSPWICCACLSDFKEATRRVLCSTSVEPHVVQSNSVQPTTRARRTQDTAL